MLDQLTEQTQQRAAASSSEVEVRRSLQVNLGRHSGSLSSLPVTCGQVRARLDEDRPAGRRA